MRFVVADEHRTFGESVRAAIGDWEPVREPELGTWQDDRDESLDARLAAVGFTVLWDDDALEGATVAGALELGRALAPVCLVDEATLGAPLWVDGCARHGMGADALAVPLPSGRLALARPRGEWYPEATLDGSGTVRMEVTIERELDVDEAGDRWCAWSAATLAYFAGLGGRALELAAEHARSRQQFGAPLASLQAVQSRLADAALAIDAATLLAWSPDDGVGPRAAALAWAGDACCEVAAGAVQVHGAIGFALESGLHRFYRRARAVHTWTTAACAAAR